MRIEEVFNGRENNYLATYTEENLKQFTVESLEKYGSLATIKESEEVIKVMLAMFTKMKQVNEQNRPIWVELLITAAYIHNLFYDGTLESLVRTREKLMPLILKHQVPVNGAAMIFQAVEGQLGEDMPIESCQPRGDSPNRIFAWACWFVEEYNGDKKMPECGAV